VRVLIVEDEPLLADRDIPGPSGDENADPFTNAVRITVSALRERLGGPGIIATVPGVGDRIETTSGART